MKKLIVFLVVVMLATPAFAIWSGTGTEIVTGRKLTGVGIVGEVMDSTARDPGRYIIVRPLSSNGLNTYVGNSAATANATQGFALSGDASETIYISNTKNIFVSSDVVGEGISWMLVK